LPEDESATVDVWIFEPSDEVRAAVAEVQAAFAHLPWIVPTPASFLHVTVHEPLPTPPFEAVYRRVNCFHEAVIVEVESEALGGFLPHLTVGYVREPGPASDLRAAVAPLRDLDVGRQIVRELKKVRAPASRTTVLQPWTVMQRR
jgi:2'-5' RNA ligase